jgi:hypothetical protein
MCAYLKHQVSRKAGGRSTAGNILQQTLPLCFWRMMRMISCHPNLSPPCLYFTPCLTLPSSPCSPHLAKLPATGGSSALDLLGGLDTPTPSVSHPPAHSHSQSTASGIDWWVPAAGLPKGSVLLLSHAYMEQCLSAGVDVLNQQQAMKQHGSEGQPLGVGHLPIRMSHSSLIHSLWRAVTLSCTHAGTP